MDDVSPAPPPPTIKAGTSTSKVLPNVKVIPVKLRVDRLIADFRCLEELLAHSIKFAIAHCALPRVRHNICVEVNEDGYLNGSAMQSATIDIV